MSAGTLNGNISGEDKNAEDIRRLSHNIKDALVIFNDMREYCSHLVAAERHEPLNLGERFKLFIKKLPELERTYGLKVELDTTECADETLVYPSMKMAQRISENCIENAAKANASKVILKYVAHETSVVITFTDDGDGMNEEELENIGFGHYSTSGGGRGVSIIRDLVNESGGIVSYQSKKGFFTEVTIKLARAVRDKAGA
jgi:signal transduction histidine kinase